MRTSLRVLIAYGWIVLLCAALLLVAGAMGSDGWAPAPIHGSRPIVSAPASTAPANAAAAPIRP